MDSEDGYAWYEGTDKAKNLIGIVDSQSYDDLEELLDQLEDGELDFGTLVIDSETKIYENIQEALLSVEERRAINKGRDPLDANISQRGWGKIKQLATRLQNAKIRMASQGFNVVSVAQNKDLTQDIGNGTRVKTGETADMAKKAPYDYDIVLHLQIKDGKYVGVVEKDRTTTYKAGDVIENPSYKNWEKRLQAKDNQGETVVKDYNKDVDKSKEAYQNEVKAIMTFPEQVKEYLDGLSSADKKVFAEKLVEVTGTNKIKKMNKEQQKAVLELMNK